MIFKIYIVYCHKNIKLHLITLYLLTKTVSFVCSKLKNSISLTKHIFSIMKVFKNMKQVIIASAAFLLFSSAVFIAKEVKAGSAACVDKYMVSRYDATSGCTYYQYFDTYNQMTLFLANQAPGTNWAYGGYFTYCTPLVSVYCPGGPVGG